MKQSREVPPQDSTLALYSRRRFLKRVLVTAAYVTPLIVSYPRTVFANHCTPQSCGGPSHMFQGMIWSPGCSQLA